MICPFRCPKCGNWVRFTYFDTAGQYWECSCGMSSQSYTYRADNKADLTQFQPNLKGNSN